MFWKDQRKTLHANYAHALHLASAITVIVTSTTDVPLLLMRFLNPFCFQHTYMPCLVGLDRTLNSEEGADPRHQSNREKDRREALLIKLREIHTQPCVALST